MLRVVDLAGADLREADTKVCAAEQASVGAHQNLTSNERVGGNVFDSRDSASQSGRNSGEGGTNIGRAIEGAARACIKDGVIALVCGDDSPGGKGCDGRECTLVLGAEDAGVARRPENRVCVSRVGDRATALSVASAIVDIPRGTSITGHCNLWGTGLVSYANNVADLVSCVI